MVFVLSQALLLRDTPHPRLELIFYSFLANNLSMALPITLIQPSSLRTKAMISHVVMSPSVNFVCFSVLLTWNGLLT
jgi:hypothetical protein